MEHKIKKKGFIVLEPRDGELRYPLSEELAAFTFRFRGSRTSIY